MKKDTVTLDIIYGTKELDIPLQLITFVILDNEPYDKCKAIIDLLEDNIDGDIVTWNVMPLSTRKTFSALDQEKHFLHWMKTILMLQYIDGQCKINKG